MQKTEEKHFNVSSVIENLTPSGLIDGSAEKTEISVVGFLKSDGASYEITYTESVEGTSIESCISVTENEITVKRRGGIESDMHFSEGLTHKSLYRVPPYTFDVEIYTKKIRKNLTSGGGKIDIFYTMKIGGADKNVRMNIICE